MRGVKMLETGNTRRLVAVRRERALAGSKVGCFAGLADLDDE